MAGRLALALVASLALAFGLPAASPASEPPDRLVSMLESGRSYRVRAQAAASLGRLRSAEAAAALVAALRDEHPVVRAAAAEALGRSGAPAGA